MGSPVWKPSVTVAGVLERNGEFLFIEEESGGERVLNQPAGHWERGETLVEACAREVLEESAYRFVPRGLVGIYRWSAPDSDVTYLRFAFCGDISGFDPDRKLDAGIVRALWLSPANARLLEPRHRSPLVWRCVEDFLAGRRYPIDLLTHFD